MTTKNFWIESLERAVKTAAQSALSAMGMEAINVLTVDWIQVVGLAGGGFVLSILSSIASAGVGSDESPSLVDEGYRNG